MWIIISSVINIMTAIIFLFSLGEFDRAEVFKDVIQSLDVMMEGGGRWGWGVHF